MYGFRAYLTFKGKGFHVLGFSVSGFGRVKFLSHLDEGHDGTAAAAAYTLHGKTAATVVESGVEGSGPAPPTRRGRCDDAHGF